VSRELSREGLVRKRSCEWSGFEPASGKGFALPHATLGVRAGRSKKYHANQGEAGDGVALAVSSVESPEGELPTRSPGSAADGSLS
jgi:hypothetical protein